jgi:hypothetical protein
MLKIPIKFEKIKCVEYISNQIIPVTKFENLNIYLESKVVDGILGWIFLRCIILIYIN